MVAAKLLQHWAQLLCKLPSVRREVQPNRQHEGEEHCCGEEGQKVVIDPGKIYQLLVEAKVPGSSQTYYKVIPPCTLIFFSPCQSPVECSQCSRYALLRHLSILAQKASSRKLEAYRTAPVNL